MERPRPLPFPIKEFSIKKQKIFFEFMPKPIQVGRFRWFWVNIATVLLTGRYGAEREEAQCHSSSRAGRADGAGRPRSTQPPPRSSPSPRSTSASRTISPRAPGTPSHPSRTWKSRHRTSNNAGLPGCLVVCFFLIYEHHVQVADNI